MKAELKQRLLLILDELVFIKPKARILKRWGSRSIKAEVLSHFFIAVQIIVCEKRKLFPRFDEVWFKKLMRKQRMAGFAFKQSDGSLMPPNLETLKIFMEFFRDEVPYGFGVTPKLALEHFIEKGKAFNCFGGAAAFGSLAHLYHFKVELAQVYDHAGIIVTLDGDRWFCDVAGGHTITKLHGVIHYENGYGWYKILRKDKLWEYKYMIVRPFRDAVTNVVLENLEFFKNIAVLEDEAIETSVPFHHREYARHWLQHHRELLAGLDIAGVREAILPDFERPYHDHEKELLLEGAHLSEVRKSEILEAHFGEAVTNAISRSRGISFQRAYRVRNKVPPKEMAYYQGEIMRFLEDDLPLPYDMPSELVLFLDGMKEVFLERKEHKEMWQYCLEKVKVTVGQLANADGL